jgi:hypothetical protein
MGGLDSAVLGCAMRQIAARKIECCCRVEDDECRRRGGRRGGRRRKDGRRDVVWARFLLSLGLFRVEYVCSGLLKVRSTSWIGRVEAILECRRI